MVTYYARAVVDGTTTPQRISVQALSLPEARRMIEGRLGKIKRWPNSPAATGSPPAWYDVAQGRTYYARAVVDRTTTPQRVSVQAVSLMEARRLIEGRLGEIKRWPNSPVATGSPPAWYGLAEGRTYYARAVVDGTMTPQQISVQAGSLMEARRLIEGRLGKIKRWPNSPTAATNAPPWYQ